MKRSRPLVVVAGLLVAGIVLLSWTQTWFRFTLTASSAVTSTVTASGSTAAASYSALAIASLALFLALTIAGRVVRIVLAVIEVLLGVFVVVTGVSALSDPVSASASAIGAVAGVSDIGAVRKIVASTTVEPWPYVGVAGGVLAVLVGLVVLVVQRRWPGPSRRYGATGRTARAMADVPRDAVVDWDDLSAGVDPTSGAAQTGVEVTASAGRRTSSAAQRDADARASATSFESGAIGFGERSQTGDVTESEEHREHH